MLNIFAVLTVLKWRRKKVNDADVISDATIVDEDNVNQKKPKKQFSFFNRQQNNNIVVEYEDIEVDKSEVFYDGQLLDIAVKKKIIKKKVNGSIESEPVAMVHPITGGNAPAAPPITIFCGVLRFNQIV